MSIFLPKKFQYSVDLSPILLFPVYFNTKGLIVYNNCCMFSTAKMVCVAIMRPVIVIKTAESNQSKNIENGFILFCHLRLRLSF